VNRWQNLTGWPAAPASKPLYLEAGLKLGFTAPVQGDAAFDEQDVARISHRDQVEDLVARGRDLERIVLSRAVRWHLDRRILCYGNKTVVFD
jgi:formyltetrahydrofolate deformylase